MKNTEHIDDSLLAAYAEGRTDAAETARVLRALRRDPRLREALYLIRSLDSMSDGDAVPMERMAAASSDSLCDVMCERRILRDYFGPDTPTARQDNRWLQDRGVPLHAVGRMLEECGMTVMRRYDAAVADIEAALAEHRRLIAVTDAGILADGTASHTLHAVVVLALHDDLLRIFDPAVDADTDMPLQQFLAAWQASRRYLVTAATGTLRYQPHPILVDDVELDTSLLNLTEAIAENAHEVWAKQRSDEGWTWGPARDDNRKLHPDMVPYSDLPEEEKVYDRIMAFNTLRLVKKLGFRITRDGGTPCPRCGGATDAGMLYCPCCGMYLAENTPETQNSHGDH